jgi:hypothetical protein
MASLPPLPADFQVDRLPISGPRLEERIACAPPADLELVERLRNLLFFDRLSMDLSDEDVIAMVEAFHRDVTNSVACRIVQERMDVRTIVAALRRRRLQMGPPQGSSEYLPTIRRQWAEPGLGLASRFDWIPRLDKFLAAGEIDEANRLILSAVYRQWTRLADQHRFSLEALLVYVARWDVLDRWVSRDAAVGRERLEQLVTETLGDYRRLY